MACSPTGIKTFIVCCNVALLFAGAAILILGLKMKWALATLLINVPVITKAFKAAISTGFFISVAGVTGITGACYEILGLILVHLFFLVVIVVMEFALGVSLMVIRTTIQNYIESPDCNKTCAATFDVVVLDYALPSSGVMMTIIIVEALMIYCAMRLYLHIRDAPKNAELDANVVHNVQMQNVSSSLSVFPHSPRLGYSPSHNYMHCAGHSYSPYQMPPQYEYQSPRRVPKPPQYPIVSDEQPPSYFEVVPSPSRSMARGMLPDISRSSLNPA